MTSTSIQLTGEGLAALDKVGLRLPGLRHTGRLAEGSRFETPTSIISTVPTGAFLEVGAFCNLSGGSINNARFGRYCSLASGVVIGPHEHPTDWLTTSRTAYFPEVNGWDRLIAEARLPAIKARKRPFPGSCPTTEIGPDVWIGQGAFIKAGVTIGAGAIIGARATVLRDVPPYAIVVGTPGKVLRFRFTEAAIARLLAVQWWRYSIYDLFDAPMDSIDVALDVIESMIASGAVQPWDGRWIGADELADTTSLASSLSPGSPRSGELTMGSGVPIPAPAADDGGPSLYGVVDVLRPDRIAGWVIDRRDSAAALDVEIHRERRVVATVKAARPRRDLERAGVGTGRYGFACDLNPPLEPGFEFTLTAIARAGDGTTEMLRRPASHATSDPDRRLLERIFEEVRCTAPDPAGGTPADLREIAQRLELAHARIEAALAALETPPTAPSHTGLKILVAIAVTMAAASLAISVGSMWIP